MEMRNTTITDIMRLSGYSKTTISRVIRDSPNVKPETREKIQKVIEDLNYQPSDIARGLVSGSVNILSLIVGDISNPFYIDITRSIQKRVFEAGYMLMLFGSDYNIELEDRCLDLILSNRFAGTFTVSATGTPEKMKKLVARGVPVVLINRLLQDVDTDYVKIDDYKCMHLAVEHLVGMGHKRIVLLNSPRHSSTSVTAYKGFVDSMRHFGIEIRDGDIVEGDLKRESGYELGLRIVESDITGVITMNTFMADGIAAAYESRGKKVPDDLHSTGLTSKINLTTVGVAGEDVANFAVDIMMRRLESEEKKEWQPHRIVLDPRLRMGGSTRKF